MLAMTSFPLPPQEERKAQAQRGLGLASTERLDSSPLPLQRPSSYCQCVQVLASSSKFQWCYSIITLLRLTSSWLSCVFLTLPPALLCVSLPLWFTLCRRVCCCACHDWHAASTLTCVSTILIHSISASKKKNGDACALPDPYGL